MLVCDISKRCELHWYGLDTNEADRGFGYRYRVAHSYIWTCLWFNLERSVCKKHHSCWQIYTKISGIVHRICHLPLAGVTVWKVVRCQHYICCQSLFEGPVFVTLICDPIQSPNLQFQIGGVKGSTNHQFMAEMGKYLFSLFITPSVCEILLAFFVCGSSDSYIHLLLIPEN